MKNSLYNLQYANKTAPLNICKLSHLSKDFHKYKTRSSSRNDFYVKYSRLNLQKNSFSRMGAKNIWNQIPAHIRYILKNSFNNKIKSLLLKNLKKTNGYYPESSCQLI